MRLPLVSTGVEVADDRGRALLTGSMSDNAGLRAAISAPNRETTLSYVAATATPQ
jgi:hypothetical protein